MKSSKPIRWNADKNLLLKSTRLISFEEISLCMETGGILKITDHPNQAQYPNQKIAIVNFQEYAYAVPFVETRDEIFLKTIIPSR